MSKRAFKTGKELEDKFKGYLQYCEDNKRFANIAGFCVFCDITRETLYKQQEYYSDSFKKIMHALEDSVVNDKQIVRSIFYLKNKFGYVDKVEKEEDVKPIEININITKE